MLFMIEASMCKINIKKIDIKSDKKINKKLKKVIFPTTSYDNI